MFFSESLECSSFDKLKRNFSENCRKKFAQLSEFARITSFVRNNPHSFPPDIWNAVLTTLQKLWRTSKNFQRKVRETMDEGFFSGNFSWKFFRRGSRMQLWPVLLRKSCQKSEKFFHFLNLFTCLFTYFFDLRFNWSWELSLKKLIWTRKM